MAEKETNEKLTLKGVMYGEILGTDFFKRHTLVFILLLVIAVAYIANGYHVHYIEQQNERLNREIKEIRAEFVATQRQYINNMKYINIQEQIKERQLGLKALQKPAYTISADGKCKK
ncbi:MAG: hypothetical protein IK117_11530 [Bacteroidales bacterium]|nr:hypothetical protein [Bacteroidales bacterium]